VYETKLLTAETDMNSVVSEFQRKSTETHEELENTILELKAKRQQCELDKFECEQSVKPVVATTTPTAVAPPAEADPFNGYDMTQGKCRNPDKYTYTRSHVYNLSSTRFKVSS